MAGAGEDVERVDDSNREAQQAAQALDRVTDHVEEKQLDENKVHKVRKGKQPAFSLSVRVKTK